MQVDLDRQGSVFVLRMNGGENRINQQFLAAMGKALNEVERSTGPSALVTVGGEPKFYSNGFDLEWLASAGSEALAAFIADVQRFLARLLAFPVALVAAINGHAFAAGALLALAHDYRVMRADRGFFCLPEIDLNLVFTPGLLALIQAKLGPLVARDLILTGKRVGGREAEAMRIIDAAAEADQVLPLALARAEELASKDRRTLGGLKRGMYAAAIRLLEEGALPHIS